MMATYRTNRWPQCRTLLGALLTLIALTGCGGSGVSEFQQVKNELQAFSDLVAEMGGKAQRKHFSVAGQEGNAWIIDLSGAQFSEEQGLTFADELSDQGYVAEMNFGGSSLNDQQLMQLDQGMCGRTVMELNLSNTGITDAAIDQLQHFYCLKNVDLTGTQVTQAAVDKWMDRRRQDPQTPKIFLKPEIKL